MKGWKINIKDNNTSIVTTTDELDFPDRVYGFEKSYPLSKEDEIKYYNQYHTHNSLVAYKIARRHFLKIHEKEIRALFEWIRKTYPSRIYWLYFDLLPDSYRIYLAPHNKEQRDNYIDWLSRHPELLDELTYGTIDYVKYIIQKRSSQIEEQILASKNWRLAVYYAQQVIGDRWIEAEYLFDTAEKVYQYAIRLGKFVDGLDDIIIQEILCSTTASEREAAQSRFIKYVREVGHGRWQRMEPVICSDKNLLELYIRDTLQKRCPDIEPAILKDPRLAAEYCRLFIPNRQWYEAEMYNVPRQSPSSKYYKKWEWYSYYSYMMAETRGTTIIEMPEYLSYRAIKEKENLIAFLQDNNIQFQDIIIRDKIRYRWVLVVHQEKLTEDQINKILEFKKLNNTLIIDFAQAKEMDFTKLQVLPNCDGFRYIQFNNYFGNARMRIWVAKGVPYDHVDEYGYGYITFPSKNTVVDKTEKEIG